VTWQKLEPELYKIIIPGEEIVDEALGRQEAANFAGRNRVQAAQVPRRTLRCSTCLTQTEGTKAKNSLKKVYYPVQSYCSGQCCGTVTIFTVPVPTFESYGSGSGSNF
jgi:hypothetical protein